MTNDSYSCLDCSVDVFVAMEYFMVSDSCWRSSGLGPRDGMLCVACLEKRIGRELKSADFSECPLNWMNLMVGFSSPLLLSRIVSGKRSKWTRRYSAMSKMTGPIDGKEAMRAVAAAEGMELKV